MASCTVATPKRDSFSTAALSARTILRLTTPRLFSGIILSSFGFKGRIETGENPPRVTLVHLVLVLRAEDRRCLDVALRIIVREAGFRVDPSHRANHLAGKQNVVYRYHLGKQVDVRLVIYAGVEKDILHQLLLQQWLFQLLRQAAKTAPVIGHRAAAVRDQELQRRKVLEQIRCQA